MSDKPVIDIPIGGPLKKDQCGWASQNPTTKAYERICMLPVAEVWVARQAEEDAAGVSTPERRYWCEGHGLRGALRREERNKKMKPHVEEERKRDEIQAALVLKEFEVLPYDKTLPARTDEDRTAKPKTRLLQRLVDRGQCIVTGPATHVEDIETGKRLELHDTPARRTDGTPED